MVRCFDSAPLSEAEIKDRTLKKVLASPIIDEPSAADAAQRIAVMVCRL